MSTLVRQGRYRVTIPGTAHFFYNTDTAGRGPKQWREKNDQSRLFGQFFPVTGNVTINVDTAGNITWTGSTIGLTTQILAGSGAINWSGSVVGLTTKLIPTAGAITWSGSALGLTTKVNVTPGVITWNGQSITLVTKIRPTAGNVLWSGALDITLTTTGTTTVTVTVPGQIVWTGSQIVLVIPEIKINPYEFEFKAHGPTPGGAW